jgi:hypothetical protein
VRTLNLPRIRNKRLPEYSTHKIYDQAYCRIYLLNMDTERSPEKILVFKRKIVRKIIEPTKVINGLWRIKTNKEKF